MNFSQPSNAQVTLFAVYIKAHRCTDMNKHTHIYSLFFIHSKLKQFKKIKSEYTLYDTSKSNCQRIVWRMRGRGFLSDLNFNRDVGSYNDTLGELLNVCMAFSFNSAQVKFLERSISVMFGSPVGDGV